MMIGQARVIYREVRTIFEGETGEGLLHVYVLCEAQGDCPIGVQGWHAKTFGENMSLMQVLAKWGDGHEEPMHWPLKAPETLQ